MALFHSLHILQKKRTSKAQYSFLKSQSEELVKKNKDWMGFIDDNKLISELAIPGTHDSGSRYGGGIAICHKWTILKQLQGGVRFLDIRCRHIRDSFHIYHGIMNQKATFDEVLDMCQQFLTENPSECIIMRLKEEHTPIEVTRRFVDTYINDYLNKREGLFDESTDIPKLGDIRGKIWLLRNFDEYDKGYLWDNCDIQDMYSLPTPIHLLKKREEAITFHERSRSERDPTKLYVNHYSGVGFAYPSFIARKVNKVALKFDWMIGIQVFDFPGEELLVHIIYQNLRLIQEQLIEEF